MQLESEFSLALGEEARWVRRVVLAITTLVAILLIGAGTLVTISVLRHERAATEVVHQHAEEFRTLVENARTSSCA